MKIVIFGTGCCSSCEILYKNTIKAANELDIEIDISKENDFEKIFEKNILSLPAISVNGVIAAQGKKLSVDEIKAILLKLK